MKNIRTILIAAAGLLTATVIHATTTSANGSVTASASVSGSTIQQGNASQSITFFRAGSSNSTSTNNPATNPVTWTEATIWYAQGGYYHYTNQYAPNIFTSNVITGNSLPPAAVGTSSIQLRVALKDYQYVDDWTTFNVTSSGGPGGGQ